MCPTRSNLAATLESSLGAEPAAQIAEAFASMQDHLVATLHADVASSKDLAQLRTEMARMSSRDEIERMRAELATKGDLAALRAEMASKDELALLRADMEKLATKQALANLEAMMASKADLAQLRTEVFDRLASQELRLNAGLARLELRLHRGFWLLLVTMVALNWDAMSFWLQLLHLHP